ncbi:hypothetical protein [Isoptericola sp. NPDC057653]|uniref:hypothetical protein n=1 Tax=Isoptericola sp. NPDC057653 TaxID=3346195 RepID=UPI00369A6F60
MGAGVRRWMAAVGAALTLALVSTGLVVPAAADDAGEDTIVVTPTEQRWWVGQDITLEVSVTQDGAPGVGEVSWSDDGQISTLWRAPLTDGRATITIPSDRIRPGQQPVVVQHIDTSSAVDPATGQYPVRSTGSVVIEVADPATPVLSATSWYYGDDHELRFDLNGTDEPREGMVAVDFGGGVERSAPLVDGVATFGLDGTEQVHGRLRFVHTTVAGSVVSSWAWWASARSKPVTLKASAPSSVRYGSDVVVPVRVTSALGTPAGRVFVTLGTGEKALASAVLVDGRATFRLPASRLGLGQARLVVRFDGSLEFAARLWSAAIVVRPRATSVAVSTAKTWTYGRARRVAVTVSSPDATPTGRVELWWNDHKVRSATLARGRASLYVPATRASAGKHRMVVKYVGPSTFERSQRGWTQKVAQARPRVTFRMNRTSFPNDWSATRSVGATVTVRTAGLPERGRLCVWSRDSHLFDDRWIGCWSNWTWRVTDGKRTIRVPGHVLGITDAVSGKTYVKLEYIPRDPNVRSVFSNTITLRHHAP